ncbi:MAG TPA: hypothetical protein VG052_16365 [Puia sp.]|nr:hypothetical protein [Puia sp.]
MDTFTMLFSPSESRHSACHITRELTSKQALKQTPLLFLHSVIMKCTSLFILLLTGYPLLAQQAGYRNMVLTDSSRRYKPGAQRRANSFQDDTIYSSLAVETAEYFCSGLET